MYKKYDCLNDDGSYDGYNSCYLHNDNKGFNFYMINDKDCSVTIYARTWQNEEGNFETNIQIKDYDEKGQEEEKYNLTFTTSDEVNLEKVYQAFEEEYSVGSKRMWNEVFEDFSFVHEPEKAKGRIHNSSLWNELKNVKNVNLEISEDWRYSGKGNVHDIYIKNEHENTVYHSENDNDYSYEERKKPSFKEITEIIYRNYNNVPDFTIEMDSKGSLWFNDDTMKEVIENKSLNSKESIDNFISELRYRMPMTQLSGKATALMKNSLIKAIEQTQKKQETKNTKQIR
jgi:hypothetical protein